MRHLNQTQIPDEPVPQLQLVNFTRVVSIGVFQSVQVEFSILARQMVMYKEKGYKPATWVIMPGQYNIFVGGQQPNQITSALSNVLYTTLVNLPNWLIVLSTYSFGMLAYYILFW